MEFYTQKHNYYCGIDLHTKTMYVVIIDSKGNTKKEANVEANPTELAKLLKPYKKDIIVGIECIFSWYWVCDWCEDNGVKFILGHALYMRAIHQGKSKSDKIDARKIAHLISGDLFPLAYAYPRKLRPIRDLLRRRMTFVNSRARLFGHIKIMGHQINDSFGSTPLKYKWKRVEVENRFLEPFQKLNCETDLVLAQKYDEAIQNIETKIIKGLKGVKTKELNIVRSIPGIGRVLGMVIVLEIGDIKRFSTVQKFASYCRLVKVAKESAGKRMGYGNSKIGNGYLKWAFSEAACLILAESKKAMKFKKRAEKKRGKGKAMAILSHRIGRSVFYMLKNERVFDENRCFGF